jgi:CMP-N-acetylneuraminic acid synthetase
MTVYDAFVFARGGSKGVKGKNIKPIAGKPLINWTIDMALASKRIRRVIVSTDSEEIAAVARQSGAIVPFIRPADLASDESSEWDAWRHALTEMEKHDGQMPKVLVSLPATAPLRNQEDINKCLDLFESENLDVVLSMAETSHSPWFNMVKQNAEGQVFLLNSTKSAVVRRQDAPVAFNIATVCYVLKSDYVMKAKSLFKGKTKGVVIPQERAIDIDSIFDFEVAQFLLAKQKDISSND